MLPKRRYLPSLGSFATFEVAAKHLSFTTAATELNVTQAAISQQIRGFEKALGVTLFTRKHNSLELTPAGESLLRSVSQGLDNICDGIGAILSPPDVAVITCSGTNASVAGWLKPFVNQFRADNPDVNFALLASDEDDALRNFDEVDISVICGNERCEVGERLYYLFPETVEPMCSPAYLKEHGPLDDPGSLAQARLLDLHRTHWTANAIGWHPVTWDDWCRATNVSVSLSVPYLVSNNYPLLLDAAVAGEGVILGWHHLVKSQLDAGRLCRLFDKPLQVDRGYYLKQNAASLDKPHVLQFIDFILSRLAGTQSKTS
ncbi:MULTISPECIES: LysR family transcriptional regulator [Roseobacteraceae]|uniref:Glycine cleavage system transcriptional activator n=1 Tax=Pseudosulfitobacter pseudonitzschiae TaxID=1402135 RepID=A0A221K7R8_9RHOB|nr:MULTISPECIES: LysR family transcriptional regulator [Roseobacteraceae]ASM75058.1 glycine cleavage system transcriptional activator [Pseudosulfitobacter pseudonitzschiae]